MKFNPLAIWRLLTETTFVPLLVALVCIGYFVAPHAGFGRSLVGLFGALLYALVSFRRNNALALLTPEEREASRSS